MNEATCRECRTPLAPGAVRCAACGKRQTIDPMVYGLVLVIALAAFVAYKIIPNW